LDGRQKYLMMIYQLLWSVGLQERSDLDKAIAVKLRGGSCFQTKKKRCKP
jgi:hypothetical protein